MSGQVLAELHGAVGVITVDRPPVNAYDAATRDGIVAALARFEANPEVRAIVLTATGTVFSAGQDIDEESVHAGGGIPYSVLRGFDQLCNALTFSPKPTIAAINGAAIGGGLEVVLACDLRVAVDTAKLAAVGVKMGLLSSSQRLVRVVGEPQARLMAFTARRVGAARALEIGLVHEVVPAADLLEHALALGREIAANAPLSVAHAKTAIQRATEVPLLDGLRFQRELFLELSQTEDHAEAVRAFREKRPPEFHGR